MWLQPEKHHKHLLKERKKGSSHIIYPPHWILCESYHLKIPTHLTQICRLGQTLDQWVHKMNKRRNTRRTNKKENGSGNYSLHCGASPPFSLPKNAVAWSRGSRVDRGRRMGTAPRLSGQKIRLLRASRRGLSKPTRPQPRQTHAPRAAPTDQPELVKKKTNNGPPHLAWKSDTGRGARQRDADERARTISSCTNFKDKQRSTVLNLDVRYVYYI